MKKIGKSAEGFGVAGVAIVVAVVGLVAFTGYYAYNRLNNSPSQTSQSTNTTTSQTQSVPNEQPETTPQPPANCPKVSQEGVAVSITLNASGAEQTCIQVSKDVALSVQNNTGKEATVTLGDRTRTVMVDSATGFDGEVGGFLQTGEHKMQVSSYDSQQYPVIWVY